MKTDNKMATKDLKIADTGELVMRNGDLAIADDLEQTQMLLMATDKGDWKQHPTAGVGVARFVESADSGGLAREVQVQYTRNGLKIDKIKVNIPNIEIEASYGNRS